MKKEGLRAALYARCSTHDKGQDSELQLVPLREYCERRGFKITGEYVDNGISGKQERRPELDRLIQTARKRQLDIILVWKLDRFGRSLKHLVTALDELSSLGVGLDHYSASRHSFCTQLIHDGLNPLEAQSAMRHKDLRSTQKYFHANRDRMREHFNRRGRAHRKQNESKTKTEGFNK